jgi:hypothetical protein
MHRRISIVALLAAGAFQAPAALCMQWQFTTGAEYSSGEYGELTSTQAMLVPFSAKFTFGALSLRASVPYLLVRGPANVAPIIEDDGGSRSSNSGSGGGGGSSGSGGGNDGGDDDEDDDAPPFADDREAHGFGDATLSATWSWNDLFATRLYADFTARVRLPTGSERKGLGNGATDYATIAGARGWLAGQRRLLAQHRQPLGVRHAGQLARCRHAHGRGSAFHRHVSHAAVVAWLEAGGQRQRGLERGESGLLGGTEFHLAISAALKTAAAA